MIVLSFGRSKLVAFYNVLHLMMLSLVVRKTWWSWFSTKTLKKTLVLSFFCIFFTGCNHCNPWYVFIDEAIYVCFTIYTSQIFTDNITKMHMKQKHHLQLHSFTKAVLHSCVSHDMSTVATATWDGALMLWWVPNSEEVCLVKKW